MAQRNADVDDQILRSDAVGIPGRNGIGRRNQRILLPVGKSVGLLGVRNGKFPLRFDAGDRLIVQHTAVIAEKASVFLRNVDQVRREAPATGAAFRIERRISSSGIGMAASARRTGVKRPFAALRGIVAADARIVVQRVPPVETGIQIPRHPAGRRIVSRYARLINGGYTGR